MILLTIESTVCVDGTSKAQLPTLITTGQTQHKMAVVVAVVFWLQFCIVETTGDSAFVLTYVNDTDAQGTLWGAV